jgi:hypothetical protein
VAAKVAQLAKVKTVGEPQVLVELVKRLGTIRPESTRRWGSLTPHEMLCHLGDAGDMVLGARPRKTPVPERRRPLVKWVALWSPIPWPHGRPTNPMHNPRAEGTRPSVFEKDLARVVDGVERIARAEPGSLIPAHGVFGSMCLADWQRWAYRHIDHHLRQFGA